MGFTVRRPHYSLVIDHFGWFRMEHHPLTLWRGLGGAASDRRSDTDREILNTPRRAATGADEQPWNYGCLIAGLGASSYPQEDTFAIQRPCQQPAHAQVHQGI